MFPTATDATALKLTVDHQGLVWYLYGEQMPYCSHSCVNQFVSSHDLPGHGVVRVVGCPENVPLVVGLYAWLQKHPLAVLEVCSPLCSEGADRRDPELVLYRMRSYGLPPSLGGWHSFGPLDYPSYALAYLLNPSCLLEQKVNAEEDIVFRLLH